MVLNAANGVESRYRNNVGICTKFDTPAIFIVNQMDHEKARL